MATVSSGLQELRRRRPGILRGRRIGLVCHAASVDRSLAHAAEVLAGCGTGRLVALFGPQHGIRGETEANMVEWSGYRDRRLGIPVHSLYGKVRKPTRAMLRNVDVLVVDLQDVGCKVYTYIWTLFLVLKAASENGVKVVVLDRPNPIGGLLLEGSTTLEDYRSFVGLTGVLYRHGLTIAELALLFNEEIGAELEVVEMRGWRRRMWFDQTGLPWVAPSPNMPTPATAIVYPATVLLEGTNCSEGRGTTRPFQMFGAPWIDADRMAKRLNDLRLPGARFRSCTFVPWFDKHRGKPCQGAEIHVVDRGSFRPYRTGAAILRALWEMYPSKACWRQPPYEYEATKLPIDIISGSDRLRRQIEAGERLRKIVSSWQADERRFSRLRARYLMYPA